jgi:serine-type D-Ala-D-Ala carboxypeptidase/endopeptidase
MKFNGLALLAVATAAPSWAAGAPTIASMRAEVHAIIDDYRTSRHVPGTVYGVVKDGRLVLVEGLGVRDPQTRTPVDADTRFRIASMSKAFTALAILKLRDEGKVDLEAPAFRYVPELRRWKLPADARPITVRDLLHHTAGFVEDNPWGDRQQVLSEAEFSALMAEGMDFANAPGVRSEYSNYG